MRTYQPSSSAKPSLNQHKPAKKRRNRVPEPQRERIMLEYSAGKSVAEISREENRNRETVAKIVNSDEMRERNMRLREKYYDLRDSALDCLRYELEVKKNGILAHKVLTDSGVIPSANERSQILAGEGPSQLARRAELHAKLLASWVMKGRIFKWDVQRFEDIFHQARLDVNDKGEIVPLDADQEQ